MTPAAAGKHKPIARARRNPVGARNRLQIILNAANRVFKSIR